MDLACACNGWLSGHAHDGLFPLPVEEKVISRLPGDARDRLFPLPVEEKAISRLPWDARGRLFPVPVEEKTILFGLSRLPVEEEAVAMACSPCLSRKRPYRGSLGLTGLFKRLWASPGLSGPLWAFLCLSGLSWAALALSGVL